LTLTFLLRQTNPQNFSFTTTVNVSFRRDGNECWVMPLQTEAKQKHLAVTEEGHDPPLDLVNRPTTNEFDLQRPS
jgi:hypothetical protein